MVFLAILLIGSQAVAREKLLEVRIRHFEYHGKAAVRGNLGGSGVGDLPEAALNLAVHAHIRICIEGLANRPGSPVEVKAKDATIDEILRQMVRQDPRYEYRERLGVVEVFPVEALDDASDCLNMVIPKFHVHYPWSMAWGQVRCQIQIVSRNPADVVPDPLLAGRCWGASHLPATPDKVLEATFERRTVRDILDELTSMAGNVGWYLPFKLSAPSCQDLDNHLAEYEPTTMCPVEGSSRRKYTESMPTGCTKCHYHRAPGRR